MIDEVSRALAGILEAPTDSFQKVRPLAGRVVFFITTHHSVLAEITIQVYRERQHARTTMHRRKQQNDYVFVTSDACH